MNVAFINENTLGHTSYLPRFIAAIAAHPEWGCTPFRIDATPLPDSLRHAERGIRGLNRLGLDGLITRWRKAASRHAADQLRHLRREHRIDAVVVNTQSVGLDLPDAAPDLPCWVALDATFEQLARSPWFSPTPWARCFHPLTLASLRRAERRLFGRAAGFLPWSAPVAASLRSEYGIAADRITVTPPSMRDPGDPPRRRHETPTRLLFVGGDFRRKGGHELLEAWRSDLRNDHVLDVITRDRITPGPGLHVHAGVEAGSEAWYRLWRGADVLVFPSHLETFGIVLLEAMAFGVPIVAARTGAAPDLVGGLGTGVLLDSVTPLEIARAVRSLTPERRAVLGTAGRRAFQQHFELDANARRLAAHLQTRTPVA